MAHKGYRRDGFTPEKRKAFLAALAKYGTIADACRTARISTTSFYRLEKKDPHFRSLAEAARSMAGADIETLAWERGVTGIEEEVIHYGKVVGTRRKRSDAVFRMILQAAKPNKYGRMSRGGETRKQIEKRVRKALREEVEKEVRAELGARPRISGKELREKLDTMLSDFNRKMGGNG
ncbi:MAG TPA: hypothetical protein VGB59_03360 [Allosphingosinicella sp.]